MITKLADTIQFILGNSIFLLREVLLSRYIVLSKLGWGHFSTVWLSKDTKHDTYVAIKIMKSSPHYMEAALDEVEFLQKVANNCYHPDWISSLKEYYLKVEKFK